MHEWALAESIILTVINESKKKKLKIINEINISIGELQQIELDIFDFAIKEILKEGDILLTLGAGDVWKLGETVLKELSIGDR